MAASCHARWTVHLVVPKLRQIQLRLLPIAAPARVVFVQERVVREEGANPRRARAFGEDHRSKAVSEVVPTPLDKYQDQVEAVSESYGKFQSFHDLSGKRDPGGFTNERRGNTSTPLPRRSCMW